MVTHEIIVTIEVIKFVGPRYPCGPDAIATTVVTSNLHDDAFADSIADEIDIFRDRFEDDVPPLEGDEDIDDDSDPEGA